MAGAQASGNAPRRAWLTASAAWLALGTAAALAGCGFALQRPPALPFGRLWLEGLDPRQGLGLALRRQLADTRVRLVDAPGQAEVVLHALKASRERSVAASTAAAQVRELTLRVRFSFRLTDLAGRELLAPAELSQERSLSYSETLALAKAQEEAELFTAMETDLAQQALRRLASAQPPQAPEAGTR